MATVMNENGIPRRKTKAKAKLWDRRDEGRGIYMDLRAFGLGRPACKPEGEHRATWDEEIANEILVDKLREIRATGGIVADEDRAPLVIEYAERHINLKGKSQAKPSTVERDDTCLRNGIVAFMGEGARLDEIDLPRANDFVAWIAERPIVRGRQGPIPGTTISAQTQLHHINAASNMMRRAVGEGLVTTNPFPDVFERPKVVREEARVLTHDESIRFLTAARRLNGKLAHNACQDTFALYACFMLTGGRTSEIYGLRRSEIDEAAGKIHFRDNRYRKLKKPHHRRSLRIWPQLQKILVDGYWSDDPHAMPGPDQEGERVFVPGYVTRFDDDYDGLVFPNNKGAMWTDLRGVLKRVLEAAGVWIDPHDMDEDDPANPTNHTLRHTYATARLQTTDRGDSVSTFTVAKELGHRSVQLVEDTYGHLVDDRVRGETVEYVADDQGDDA